MAAKKAIEAGGSKHWDALYVSYENEKKLRDDSPAMSNYTCMLNDFGKQNLMGGSWLTKDREPLIEREWDLTHDRQGQEGADEQKVMRSRIVDQEMQR